MEKKNIQRCILCILIVSLIFTGITIPVESKASETYMVFFDSQGGSFCNYITDIPEYARVALPLPVKQGYEFKGWYKDKNCTDTELFGYSMGLITENILLYAKWVQKEISKVEVRYIGETIIVNNAVKKDDFIVILNYIDGSSQLLKKEEYEIKDPVIKEVSNYNQIVVTYKDDLGKVHEGKVWVKSVKEPVFCIGFDTMGGSSVAPITAIPRNSYVKLPNEPERDGYVFSGWYMEKTYERKFTAEQPINETFIVYAKWVEEDQVSTETEKNNNNIDSEEEPEVLEKEVLKLNMEYASVEVGGTESIFVETVNPYLEVYYESLDEKIAKINSNGIVTGVKDGRTVVRVYAEGGHSFTCKVGVGTQQYITNFEINVTAKRLKKGKTFQIDTEITPETISQSKISYTSTDPSIATVSKDGLITAKAPGICYIMVTSNDGTDITKKVKIRVI